MKFPIALISLALTACATTNTNKTAEGGEDKAAKAGTQLTQAAVSPLSDLNLMRQEMPAILIAAQTRPYAVGTDRSCAALATEIQALDAALGADLDVPGPVSEAGLADQGVQAVGDAAIGAVRSTAEGVLPFRGWLRKLTGAERRDREQAAAIAAGTIRRAYLKGMGQSLGCLPPAAPRVAATVLSAPEVAKPAPQAKP